MGMFFKRVKFGKVAVLKQYATEEKIEEALKIQKQLCEKGMPYKKIGEILVDMNVLTGHQVEEIIEFQGKPLLFFWLGYLFSHRR